MITTYQGVWLGSALSLAAWAIAPTMKQKTISGAAFLFFTGMIVSEEYKRSSPRSR